ncbi:hypothetical protein ACJ73_07918 [Blastomyces percursus]|uniref:DUF7514 domain-containing protein n=1 Tax=Blastomyces percursus TaxID=1658174 RepID=A0A1J9QZK5_9EURO|nr:hypothetical protein ACJ73_07918 [Blastomyces percursus]
MSVDGSWLGFGQKQWRGQPNTLFYYLVDVSGPCRQPSSKLILGSLQLDPPEENIYWSNISQHVTAPQGNYLPSTGIGRWHTSPIFSKTSDETRDSLPKVPYESIFRKPSARPKNWNLLFQKNGNPTFEMSWVLYNIARAITDYGTNPCTPDIMLKRITNWSVGRDSVPWTDMFHKHSKLSLLYSELCVEHIFVQARTNESPTIPALTLLALQCWMMLLTHAYPRHEYFRLFRIAQEELEHNWLLEEWPKIRFPEPGDNRAKRTVERAFSKHLGATCTRPAETRWLCYRVKSFKSLTVSTSHHEDNAATDEQDSVETIHWLVAQAVGAPRPNVVKIDKATGRITAPATLRSLQASASVLSTSGDINSCETQTYDAFYTDALSKDGDSRIGSDYDGDCEDSQTEKGTVLTM